MTVYVWPQMRGIYNMLVQELICENILASTRENLSSGFANNKGADQPTHPRSLVSDFVNRLLENIISRLTTIEISFFSLALLLSSCFESHFVGNPEDRFSLVAPLSTHWKYHYMPLQMSIQTAIFSK